jgi:hypothetical protein
MNSKATSIFSSAALLIILFLGAATAKAQAFLDFELGLVSTGYNNVRIPGDEGTRFSLKDDLKPGSGFFYRVRLGYTIASRHTLSLLYAPLQVSSAGSVPNDILFEGVLFPANSDLDAIYKFNSYRLTYRYDLVKRNRLEFGMGFTAKIRDARIALSSPGLQSEKTNVGFVPIVNFRLLWNMNDHVGLLFEGDALVAPQGRAEDVLLALTYAVTDRIGIRAGYRILEGGADNDEVYNFSLFHYASAGLSFSF